jgi:hypothetical protein
MNKAERFRNISKRKLSVEEQNQQCINDIYTRLLVDMKSHASLNMTKFRVFKDNAIQYGLDDNETQSICSKIIEKLEQDGFVVTRGKTGWGIFGLPYIEISWGN